ncbi:MAG: metallophosphoesterase [Acidobacteriota bacterium]|nr:metallophosphoesterase [Acidobacteriota bacterium]
MNIAVIGDVHGHLALMYAILGRWQKEAGRRIDLILQLGDMGAFLPSSQLDQATKKYSQRDPDELGFAEFAGAHPPVTLLDPRPPLVFIPGNHEDFDFLEECGRRAPQAEAIYPVSQDGKICALRSGRIYNFGVGDESVRIAGVSGIAHGRQKKGRHVRYYLSDEDALRLAGAGVGAIDILISHEGPNGLYADEAEPVGSGALRLIIEEAHPRFAFFAHYGRAGEWRIGWTEVLGMTNCSYVPSGDWPLWRNGVAVINWEQEQSSAERICPPWLIESNRYNWRHWGKA